MWENELGLARECLSIVAFGAESDNMARHFGDSLFHFYEALETVSQPDTPDGQKPVGTKTIVDGLADLLRKPLGSSEQADFTSTECGEHDYLLRLMTLVDQRLET